MTAVLAFALLLEACGIALLRYRLGKAWLRRPMTICYLASVAYQGVSAALLTSAAIRQQDIFRQGIAPAFADDAALLTSAAMLALVIGYLATQPQRVTVPPSDRYRLTRALDWRLATATCAPLAVLTYEGRGYAGSVGLDSSNANLGTQLAVTLFAVLTVIAAFALIVRHPRLFVPVLSGQTVLLAAAGERWPVLTAAVALCVLLANAGLRPSPRQAWTAIALTAVAILSVTGVRAAHGRSLQDTDSGLPARAAALATAVTSPGTPPAEDSPGLASQATQRFDGNSFTAAILQARARGEPRLPATIVPESVLVTVPSVLWPSKLGTAGIHPVAQEATAFGLQPVNFLPTLPGLYTGFLPWPWLIALMAILGGIVGWGERWLLREASPVRFVMLAGAVTAALDYEGGLPGMLLDLRAAAIIAVAAWALDRVRSRSSDLVRLGSNGQSARLTEKGERRHQGQSLYQ